MRGLPGLTRAARTDALVKLAKEANYLASLINLEIHSHGFEQKPLIELAKSQYPRGLVCDLPLQFTHTSS